eukprot:scaffold20142_cov69-Phaeocystis_antarctica.AAC.1
MPRSTKRAAKAASVGAKTVRRDAGAVSEVSTDEGVQAVVASDDLEVGVDVDGRADRVRDAVGRTDVGHLDRRRAAHGRRDGEHTCRKLGKDHVGAHGLDGDDRLGGEVDRRLHRAERVAEQDRGQLRQRKRCRAGDVAGGEEGGEGGIGRGEDSEARRRRRERGEHVSALCLRCGSDEGVQAVVASDDCEVGVDVDDGADLVKDAIARVHACLGDSRWATDGRSDSHHVGGAIVLDDDD